MRGTTAEGSLQLHGTEPAVVLVGDRLETPDLFEAEALVQRERRRLICGDDGDKLADVESLAATDQLGEERRADAASAMRPPARSASPRTSLTHLR